MPGTRRIIKFDDPASLVRADKNREIAPERSPLDARRIEAIWQAVEDLFATRVYPTITFCLRYRGQVLINRSIGYAQGLAPEAPLAADARLAEPDTPVCLFSASKAIIALLAHKLAEEGGIDLDAPVSHYLPEFACNGKSGTTISEVLAHRGGFPEFPEGAADPELLTDWDACVARVCEAPRAASGKSVAYHAVTGGFVLGEIIRRVTGKSVTDYLDSRLRKPLGMRYFTYGLDGRSRARVATNHVAGMPLRWPVSKWAAQTLGVPFDEVVNISNRDMFMDAVIPSGNLYATAEELSRFFQMLLDGGVYRNRRVFKADTVARAIRPVGYAWPDRMLKVPMRYSEGLMLGMSPVGMYGPMSADTYGHLGLMNILGWADPARDVSCGLLTTGKAVLGGHLVALSRLFSLINWHCGDAITRP